MCLSQSFADQFSFVNFAGTFHLLCSILLKAYLTLCDGFLGANALNGCADFVHADNEIFGFGYMDCCKFVAASLPPASMCYGPYVIDVTESSHDLAYYLNVVFTFNIFL
ncbi:hypothetical protein RIF29_35811 [Crotalaria pallida]|uniref:Uncharacterized protein n=1 Tax=Crotalaria pallida TaxID=3830 RepID=A0AAN9ECL4_CROPI